MVEQTIDSYVVAVVHEIRQILGAKLHSIFSYGSASRPYFSITESNIDLLVVLVDTADLHETRLLLGPLWQKHGKQLKRPPRVGLRKTVLCHLQLEPLFLHHLQTHGTEYTQTGWLDQVRPLVNMPEESFLIQESFHASQAICQSEYRADLARLVRSVDPDGIARTAVPAKQLSAVWRAIHQKQQGSILGSHVAKPTGANPTPIPHLVALYSRLDVMIAVVSSADALTETRWSDVADWLQKERSESLHLTTPTQFLSLLHHYGALDVRMLSYDHLWGTDIVKMLSPSIRQVRQAAARYATRLQMAYYSDHYFSDPATPAHGQKHIHDLQNKLLNLRLQNEILSRLKLLTPFIAPEELPPRGTPHPQRFYAIYQQLGWWAEYYLAEQSA